ncbi:transposase [Nocardia sp. NPDC051911]|uniref:transposase n=1 Tax=Nocardia sp. NPDC051911 TaxID=3154648 RepID=UPI00343D2BD2
MAVPRFRGKRADENDRRSRPSCRNCSPPRNRRGHPAEILVVVGDNPERIKYEAALAKLTGISPVPTGAGMTGGRYRINHGGHRQLNAAIYHTVIVRMRFHQPTMAISSGPRYSV